MWKGEAVGAAGVRLMRCARKNPNGPTGMHIEEVMPEFPLVTKKQKNRK